MNFLAFNVLFDGGRQHSGCDHCFARIDILLTFPHEIDVKKKKGALIIHCRLVKNGDSSPAVLQLTLSYCLAYFRTEFCVLVMIQSSAKKTWTYGLNSYTIILSLSYVAKVLISLILMTAESRLLLPQSVSCFTYWVCVAPWRHYLRYCVL